MTSCMVLVTSKMECFMMLLLLFLIAKITCILASSNLIYSHKNQLANSLWYQFTSSNEDELASYRFTLGTTYDTSSL